MSGLDCVHLIGREVWLGRETLVSEKGLMRVGTLRFAHPTITAKKRADKHPAPDRQRQQTSLLDLGPVSVWGNVQNQNPSNQGTFAFNLGAKLTNSI